MIERIKRLEDQFAESNKKIAVLESEEQRYKAAMDELGIEIDDETINEELEALDLKISKHEKLINDILLSVEEGMGE